MSLTSALTECAEIEIEIILDKHYWQKVNTTISSSTKHLSQMQIILV